MTKNKTEAVIENGFKETEIGLIPSDWDITKLGDCIDTKKGRKPETLTDSFKDNFEPYLTAGYFRTGNTKQFVDVGKEKNSIIVDKEDIVLIWDGSNAGDVFTGLRGVLASTMVKIVPKANLTRQHLFYFLKTKFDILNEKTTGSTIPHVSKSIFENLPLPLPLEFEQQKISFVLSKIQQAIEQQDKIIQITKGLKKSLMSRLFSEGLHSEEQKETEIGLVPKSWEVVTVGDTCEKPQYGYTESSTHKPIGPKFLRITDITEKGVNWTEVPYCKCPKDLIEKYKLQREDIVFARIGATTGKSYIIKDCPLAVYASYLIRVRTKEKVYSTYLYYFFNSDMYWQQINANKGSSLKMGVNGSILAVLKFPLPKIEEQKEIVNILSSIDKKLTQSEYRKQTLQALFKTMLNQLMTGKVRVKNLDIEVN